MPEIHSHMLEDTLASAVIIAEIGQGVDALSVASTVP